jgi:hypothetical protein
MLPLPSERKLWLPGRDLDREERRALAELLEARNPCLATGPLEHHAVELLAQGPIQDGGDRDVSVSPCTALDESARAA